MAVQPKSKITVAGTRAQVQALLAHSLSPDNKRNLLETVELQFGLTNNDPAGDKRFSGSVKLPSATSTTSVVLSTRAWIACQAEQEQEAHQEASALVRCVCLLGYQGSGDPKGFRTGLVKGEDLAEKIINVKSTIRFRLRKNLCIAMAIGNVDMTTEQLVASIMITINYLVSCLKKGWSNVNSTVIKSTMWRPRYLF
ncbi:60S ribosomal protein L10A [Podospora pseudocomata]|uniref:60S ribosomal protein L10A n=1 Tax=Podospora pseudocomata TaxID=2093779 RepID=A0ABR0GWR2_9PEZI|nr:60S ribosomal protein L10A [Podospora pseudocomata]